MRCDDVRRLLDDHVDSETSPAEARSIEEHLEACESCRAEERGLRELVTRLHALPATMESPGDGWPAIERRLDSGSPPAAFPAAAPVSSIGRVVWRGLVAASVLLAVFAAGYYFRPVIEPQRTPDSDRPASARLDVAASGTGLEAAERALLEVKRQLRAGLDARRSSLSPRTVEMVDRNLAEIEASIDEIKKALTEDPGSRELRRQLMAAHRQEIYLLKQATQVAARL